MPTRHRVLAPLLALVAATLVGCASSSGYRDPGAGESPRVRCLSDSRSEATSGTRPLFFLFCAEAP